ncbi:uncharacterized protein LOC143182095 [Calliopsis andreniformis]|uniref:uncharacterized protein LOC143182095 n=1 Tax=Calliopsis andreniformis TaxID=337506 RepID=UPI003FCC376C
MDLTSSRDSYSPTTKRADKPPFRLCFSQNRLPGRSTVYVPKIDGEPITPKFYSKEYEDVNHLDASEALERATSKEKKSSEDVRRWPLLTSRAYGWWHSQGIEPTESRFNFRKKTSDLVNMQLKIYAEDRRLKGLKY